MSRINLKLFRIPGVSSLRVGPGNVVLGNGFPADDLDVLNQALHSMLPPGSRLRQALPHMVRRLRGMQPDEPRIAFWLEAELPPSVSEASAQGIASDLKEVVPLIEKAYVAPRFRPAQSGHLLESAHGGIGAVEVWPIAGGAGSGVKVGLVDHGYELLNPYLPYPQLHGSKTTSWAEEHGTWCAGIVLGRAAGPAPGIAPDAQAHLSPIIDWKVAQALDNFHDPAWGYLDRGDVVWIPQETETGDPVESESLVHDAVRTCTHSFGIVVVEAAGNGGAGGTQLHVLAGTGEDTGAILAGAGGSGTDPLHPAQQRLYGNYGGRVDCQGWGEHVLTLQPGGGTHEAEKTSAASSMVAGIAAVVESVAKSCSRGAISPEDLRAALRDTKPTTAKATQPWPLGLPCQGPDPIGPLPDLRMLLEYFELFPDSYLRDHVGDDGVEPSDPTLTVWASPDIIPRLQVEADPETTLGGAHWDLDLAEVPAQGSICQLYVRLQNRSFVDQDVTVDLYWADQGAWISPSQWQPIGTIAASSPGRDYTGAGSPERVVAGPLAWQTPTVTEHPCLIAVLQSAVDPAPIPTPMTDDVAYAAFVRDHNNVTHRNVVLGEATLMPFDLWVFRANAPATRGGRPVLRPMTGGGGRGPRAYLGLGRGRPVPTRGGARPLPLEEVAEAEGLGVERSRIVEAFHARRFGDARDTPLPGLWIPIHEGGDLVLEDVAPGDSVPVVVLLRAPAECGAKEEIRIVQYSGDLPIGAVTYRIGPQAAVVSPPRSVRTSPVM